MQRFVCVAFSVSLLASQGAAAQSSNRSIQGVWKVVEASITGPGARVIPFAERPNLTIIAEKHYSRVEVQADGPRQILTDVANATAEQLRAVWGPVVAEAGTYELASGGLV